ncbi:MAG: hypothetical protein ACE141_03080 [Bryobacteraceae bacterium]
MRNLYRIHALLAAAGAITTAAGQSGVGPERFRPTVTLQTGFAPTFQLNLGGTFGDGPAWQNRAIVDFVNVAAKGDAVTLNGWMTIDTPSRRRDWIAGAGYRAPAWQMGRGSLTVTAGWQRWLFPSVLCGVRDHLVALNGVYRTRWKLPITVTADHWVILKSPLRKGNLTLVQVNVAHQLHEGRGYKLVLRHGPSTSYSHEFWDRPGWRVFRYGASVALEAKRYTLEAGVRQQAGIAPRVPDNTYWTVLLTRRL